MLSRVIRALYMGMSAYDYGKEAAKEHKAEGYTWAQVTGEEPIVGFDKAIMRRLWDETTPEYKRGFTDGWNEEATNDLPQGQ